MAAPCPVSMIICTLPAYTCSGVTRNAATCRRAEVTMFYYHKGLTRAARRTVVTAITIAGRQGCTAVDTGHLLLAMLQTGRGTAVEFLRRKQITVTALMGWVQLQYF